MTQLIKIPCTLLTLALIVAALSGCSSYKLRGTVIEAGASAGFNGPTTSRIMVVDKDDARLQHLGLGGVQITVTQDPLSLNHKNVGQGYTNGKGQFSIAISSFGAGFLEYQMGIIARRKAHTPAQRIMQLPGSDERLLIILSPGKNKLNQKHIDFLEKAFKESQPYLDK